MPQSPPHLSSNSDRRVVVAEDSKVTLRLMSTWLADVGFDVFPASDGREALRAICETQPSILVTDWNMPGMSGLELCREIRRNEQIPYIYVLMATSRDDRSDVIRAIEAGADDFVAKPIKQHDLQVRVEQAVAALRRVRQFLELAETDDLTGTMNRRRFLEHFVREIARADLEDTPLSCLLVDVDFFKQINDTHGHSAGDAALSSVAEVLRLQTRATDCVCRYGGDEFCVLLPGMVERDALAFSERFRQAISAKKIAMGDRVVGLSVTAGVAEWRRDIVSPRQLIDMADEALLSAKRCGRDCTIAYGISQDLHHLSAVGEPKHAHGLSGVFARDIMTTPAVTLAQDRPISAAGDMFLRLRISCIPIVDSKSQLVGIVSEKDLLNAISAEANWSRPISEVMKTRVVCYDEETPATTIWEYLRQVSLRRVIIVANGVPTGVISRGTLLRWLGNWGPILRQRRDQSEGNEFLWGHIQATATAIALEVESLLTDMTCTEDQLLLRTVNAATRIQDQAQNLVALSQVHYAFQPQMEDVNSLSGANFRATACFE